MQSLRRCLVLLVLVLVAAGGGAHARPSMAMKHFSDWLKSKGADVGPVQVRDLGRGRGGRGLFAADDILGGTRIIRIPIYKAVLTLEHAFESPGLGEAARSIVFQDDDLWAIFLNHELRRVDSPWADYLRTLPTKESMTLPIFFSDEEIALLKGSVNEQFVKSRRGATERNYDRAAGPIFKRFPKVFADKEEYSLDDHKWGLAIVWSRMMEIKVRSTAGNKQSGDSYGEWVPVRVLVPLVDMINMGTPDENNVICRTHSSGDFVDCVADRDIPAGTEILRQYHEDQSLPNTRLFNEFGFAMEHNSEDAVPIPMPTMERIPLLQLKQRLISQFPPQVAQALEHETKKHNELTLNWKRALYQLPGFMAYMRVLDMSAKDMQERPLEALHAVSENKPISKTSEKAMVDRLVALLTERLKTYPTTMEEDSALLDELHKAEEQSIFEANTNKRIIYTVLYAEKRLIALHIQMLKDHYLQYVKSLKQPSSDPPSSGSQPSGSSPINDEAKGSQVKGSEAKDNHEATGSDYKVNKAWQSKGEL